MKNLFKLCVKLNFKMCLSFLAKNISYEVMVRPLALRFQKDFHGIKVISSYEQSDIKNTELQ